MQNSKTSEHRQLAAIGGGLLGGLLAAACCIGPLLLVSLGVSGAWIGNLSALEPYRPVLMPVSIALLGGAFWLVYRRPARDCEGRICQVSRWRHATLAVLWLAALLVVASLSADWWAPLFY